MGGFKVETFSATEEAVGFLGAQDGSEMPFASMEAARSAISEFVFANDGAAAELGFLVTGPDGYSGCVYHEGNGWVFEL